MNKKQKLARITENWKKYCVPGMPPFTKRKKNAVFVSPANSKEHEIAKLLVCLELRRRKHDFVTEALKKSSGARVDVVDLVTGYEYEIETTKRRAKRFEGTEVIVVKLWEDKDVEDYVEDC